LRRHGQYRKPFSGLLAGLARSYLAAYENDDANMAWNGEVAMLRRLAPVAPRIALDVGANHGDWALAALDAVPGMTVHAFEIVPATARALAGRLADEPRCVVNDFGLGETEGSVILDVFPGNDTLSTRVLGLGLHAGTPEKVAGKLRRGADYCTEHGIDSVDILKIDVEGAEHLVLDGFGDMLGSGRIGLVQFEYGIANVGSRVLLQDFHARFGAAGFEIGKLYPHGVAFAAYRPEQEDFRGPNFVAVHRGRPELRAAVAA
jgi:FkbM family methyltransferase